jgi:hypothetical protein
MSRQEMDERLRRAAEVRRTLRRATRKLMQLGERALADRGLPVASAVDDHRSR